MEFLLAALQLTPLIVHAGESLETFVEGITTTANKDGGPTQADFDALTAQEDALRAKINAAVAADAGTA